MGWVSIREGLTLALTMEASKLREMRMKAPGVIAIVGGAGALALLWLAILQRPEQVSDKAPAVAKDSRAPAAPPQPAQGAPPPSTPLPGVSPQPAPIGSPTPGVPSQPAPAASPMPGAVKPGPAPAVESANHTAPAPPPVSPEVQQMLQVAQQSSDESGRLRAVKWLGAHADLYQFEAIQQIQMSDPDEQVRQAAEAAANELRVRHADKEWPNVPRNADPRDYMRKAPDSSP